MVAGNEYDLVAGFVRSASIDAMRNRSSRPILHGNLLSCHNFSTDFIFFYRCVLPVRQSDRFADFLPD